MIGETSLAMNRPLTRWRRIGSETDQREAARVAAGASAVSIQSRDRAVRHRRCGVRPRAARQRVRAWRAASTLFEDLDREGKLRDAEEVERRRSTDAAGVLPALKLRLLAGSR
jgi:hypothetical protein